MKIIKASAGSGKTYKLSHTYIDYLLESGDEFGYRHLMAVTFTNKATAEMKARILRDLSEMGRTRPEARKYLIRILHDYGAFGVSTIDRFFQQTLRAFARELGQHSSWQVELDKLSLIEEAVGRVLDGLTEDKMELAEWLRTSALEQILQNKSFSLDKGLVEMGRRIKSEEFRQLAESVGFDPSEAWSKERLKKLRLSCDRIIKAGEEADPAAYATASIVRRSIYALGLAREFEQEYSRLLEEKNVLPLDESNNMLRDIIDGSDAPFVYEKTGSRYTNYLLDEFQDTSRMQWKNFLPLLRDADASGDNLIVGDVKQSIYRWRDSDWQLLGTEVKKEFPNAEEQSSDENWRSARQVVEFNNEFFKFAAGKLGLQEMYSNVEQVPRSGESQPGCVKVEFTDDQIAAVLQSVKDVRDRGARYGDIAVLVRKNSEGARVAEALIKADIPVISDDSLDLKRATSVRRLVSLLNYYEDTGNKVGSYIAGSIGITFPESYHSLIDFCESLLRDLERFDPETFRADTLYISSFMDLLQDWVSRYGNNLRSFMRFWDEKEERFIGSPENSDSVRVLTIHKSKGLEFPHVIFPFADKVKLSDKDIRWCVLEGELGGIYPVQLSGTSLKTDFAGAWEKERAMQVVDNINIFYVALTRAVKSLHVIAKLPAKGKMAKLDKGKDVEWSYFSELLYAKCAGRYTYGTPYEFSRMERVAVDKGERLQANYVSVPLGGRLRASEEASDYFGEGGLTGSAASGRLRGIELHRILSGINSAEDLPKGINAEDYGLLKQRVEAHPEWFAQATGARNELSIFAADGSRNRPDRVVYGPDGGVVIIDYKFGAERETYLWQLRRYKKLYREMGSKSVRGYIWYVPEDKVVEV